MFCPIAHCNELRVQGTMLLFKESQIRRHINTCMVHCIATCCILVHRNTVQQAGIGALYTCTEGCNAIWLNAKYDNAPRCNPLLYVQCNLALYTDVLRCAMQFGSVQNMTMHQAAIAALYSDPMLCTCTEG